MSNEDRMLEAIRKAKQQRQKIEQRDARAETPDFLMISQALDEYYFVNKLSLYCADLCYSKILQREPREFSLLQALMTYVDQLNDTSVPLDIYNRIRKLLEGMHIPIEQMTLFYEETFQLVVDHEAIFSDAENIELYSLLSNYCIRRINAREERWNERFVLIHYRMLSIQFKSRRSKAILQPGVLKNIVVTALSIDNEAFFESLSLPAELDVSHRSTAAAGWTERLIQSYYKKLPDTNLAKNYLIYCKSYLEFMQGNFPRAYKILENHTRVRGTFLNLDFKVLHLKILYETNARNETILKNDEIAIRDVLEAYRKMIQFEENEKQELSYQMQYYQKFRAHYGKLFRLHQRKLNTFSKRQRKELIRRKEEFKETIEKDNFSFNTWMINKLNKMD